MMRERVQGGGEGVHRETDPARLVAAAGQMVRISAKQQKALALILSGCALGEVAQRVGVSRGTIYNWTHRQEPFVAAMESWRRDMAKATRARLLGLSGMAFKAIALALERGDARVALAMFKGLGVLEEGRGKEEGGGDEPSVVIYRRGVDRG